MRGARLRSSMKPRAAIEQSLKAALAAGPPMRLVMLFGSAVSERMRADSDVDIAIWPVDEGLELAPELELQARLSAVCGREVDLVRLDRASTLLRWKVAQSGVCLLASPAVEEPRFRARAGIEHAELRVIRDPCAERFRRRLAAGPGARGTP